MAVNRQFRHHRESREDVILAQINYDGLVATLKKYFVGPNIQASKRRFSDMPLMKRAMQESRQVKGFFQGGGRAGSARKQPKRK